MQFLEFFIMLSYFKFDHFYIVLCGTLSRLCTVSPINIIQLPVVEFQKLERRWHRQVCKNCISKMRYEKNWNLVPSFRLGKKSGSSWSEQKDVVFQPKISLATIYLPNARPNDFINYKQYMRELCKMITRHCSQLVKESWVPSTF